MRDDGQLFDHFCPPLFLEYLSNGAVHAETATSS